MCLRSQPWRRCVSIAVLAIALCSVSERVTAQIREPKIRIAVDPDTTLLNPERLPALNPLRFSGDGAYLFVSGRGMIRRYDLARRQFDVLLPLQNQVLREAQSNKPVFLVDEYAVSSDGSRLAVVNPEESKIHVIDLESGDTLHELPLPYQYDVVSVMDELFFSHDDTRLTIRRHDAGTHYVADIDGDGWEVIEADDFSLSNSGRLAILDSNSRRVTIRGSHLSNPMTTTKFEDPVVTLSLSSVPSRKYTSKVSRLSQESIAPSPSTRTGSPARCTAQRSSRFCSPTLSRS